MALLFFTPLASGTVRVSATPCGAEGAWACVRRRLPASVPVLHPTWLPARFRVAPVVQTFYSSRREPVYWISYRSRHDGDSLLFALGGVNSWRPDSIQRIRVRGVRGWIETSSGWPSLQVVWQEGPWHYAVQAHGVSRMELLHSVTALMPMKPVI